MKPALRIARGRARGRPVASGTRHRALLLAAARELLAEPGGHDLVLRQVALRAGVTPALAHYYFANREGLLAALIDEQVAPDIETLASAVRAQAAKPVVALTLLMQKLTALTAGDRFLQECLLLPAAQSLRNRLRALLHELLQHAQIKGQLRADLSPAYLRDTLLGMCLFPFLDNSAAETRPGEHAAALTLQHVALLQDGIVCVQRPRQDAGS